MRSKTRISLLSLLLGVLWSSESVEAATMQLIPSKDNTLIETEDGSASSGAGSAVFVGRTGQQSESRRRAAMRFDLSWLPNGAEVQSARLRLRRVQGPSGSAELGLLALHALSQDWGEGESSGDGGKGAASERDDATWIHTFFDPDAPESAPIWVEPGGDYAQQGVAISTWDETQLVWDSAELADQLQAWLDAPESDFGWLLIGDETQANSSLRLGSREAEASPDRPLLTITYIPDAGARLLQLVALMLLAAFCRLYTVVSFT